MKLIMIIVGFLLTSVNKSYSQKGRVHLSGKIDTSIINKHNSNTLSIKLNQTTNIFNMGSIIEVPLKPDGSYSTLIPCHDDLMYISFWLTDNATNGKSNGAALKSLNDGQDMQERAYLFENGDSVSMHINKSGYIGFRGKESNKLNCQSQIYTINFSPVGLSIRKADLLNVKNLMAPLELDLSIRNLVKEMKLEILSSFKNEFSEKIYNTIYLDIIASYQIPLHAGLFWYGYKKPVNQSIIIAQQFLEQLCKIPNPPAIDSNLYAGSSYYPELLFLKEFNSLRLYSTTGKYENGDSFASIYQRLKSKYTGKLRDKLLLICFERLNRKFPTEARNLVEDALNIMTDISLKQTLETWANKQDKAYAFELNDENGKTHRLEDYKGKVLVIDFWFTGCGACVELNAAMHPIIQKYKDNKKIVFMTINTDQYKSQWLKSIKTGKYTSLETINLYTDGLRDQHPMIRYYNYKGAPQQLIIGPKGNIISSHPPRPNYALDRRNWPRNKEGLLEPSSKEILSNPYALAFMKLITSSLNSDKEEK